jgi:hypothetical protein
MATALVPRPGWSKDEDLGHCVGYRVDGVGGRIGFVDDVRPGGGGPELLAVRAGRWGKRLLMFSAVDVAFVVPRTKRIYLAASAAPVASEPIPSFLATGAGRPRGH